MLIALLAAISLLSLPTLADAGVSPACNPGTQAGCNVGQKCAQLVASDEPFAASTACVPDGTVPVGGACTRGAAGPNGYDNCIAGNDCLRGVCRPICDALNPDACTEGEVCTKYADLFSGEFGLCVPECDPVEQDCPSAEACYLNIRTGSSSCSAVPAGSAGLTQGADCLGPAAGSCYLNGCDEGFAAILPNEDLSGNVCAFLCNPFPTFKGANGPVGAASGNPCGVTCGSSFADRPDGPGHDFECRYIQTFYSNATAPATTGMCVDAQTWGSCEDFDLARFEQLVADEDAASYTQFCDDNPAACVFGCMPTDFVAADAVEPACDTPDPDAGVQPSAADAGTTTDEEAPTGDAGCGCQTGGSQDSSGLLLLCLGLVVLGLRRQGIG